MHIIFASLGNDSVALIQWAIDQKLEDIIVAYSDTGWASPDWGERINVAREWLAKLSTQASKGRLPEELFNNAERFLLQNTNSASLQTSSAIS